MISVPEEALENATYAELAPLFCAGTTVYDAIRVCSWAPGDVCLVQGIGGLGHLAVQVGFYPKRPVVYRILTLYSRLRWLLKWVSRHARCLFLIILS